MKAVEAHAEILVALMWGPKTINELMPLVDCHRMTVHRWLEAMHDSGCVRIAGEIERGAGESGRPERIWAMQTSPYKLPDWRPRLTPRQPAPQPATPDAQQTAFRALCTACVQPATSPADPESAPASPPLQAANPHET